MIDQRTAIINRFLRASMEIYGPGAPESCVIAVLALVLNTNQSKKFLSRYLNDIMRDMRLDDEVIKELEQISPELADHYKNSVLKDKPDPSLN